MKLKTQLLTLSAVMYSFISLKAQSDILKTVGNNAKNSATNKAVETANTTINNTLNSLLSGKLFRKKEKENKNIKTDTVVVYKDTTVAASVGNATELSVANVDYAAMGALAEIIKSNKNVTDVQRSFGNGLGTINIVHTCKTEDLLDDIIKNTAGKYEVAELSAGKIKLKTKKP